MNVGVRLLVKLPENEKFSQSAMTETRLDRKSEDMKLSCDKMEKMHGNESNDGMQASEFNDHKTASIIRTLSLDDFVMVDAVTYDGTPPRVMPRRKHIIEKLLRRKNSELDIIKIRADSTKSNENFHSVHIPHAVVDFHEVNITERVFLGTPKNDGLKNFQTNRNSPSWNCHNFVNDPNNPYFTPSSQEKSDTGFVGAVKQSKDPLFKPKTETHYQKCGAKINNIKRSLIK